MTEGADTIESINKINLLIERINSGFTMVRILSGFYQKQWQQRKNNSE
jgi:hypothetical protein